MTRRIRRNRPVLGAALLIAIGAALLVGNLSATNILDKLWPFALAAVGAWWVVSGPRPLGVIALGAGMIVIAEWLGAPVDLASWWPVLLIALGVLVLMPRQSGGARSAGPPRAGARGATFGPDDEIEFHVRFAQAKNAVTSTSFRGGNVSTRFGGAEIDMRHAEVAEGGAALDLDTAFGSITLIVPSDWVLDVNGALTFGGFKDTRAVHPSEGPTLRLDVSTMMGGVHITD